MLRWGLLGPLSALVPPLRRLVVARASTLDINPRFRRAAPTGRARTTWLLQEALMTLIVWGAALVFGMGWLPAEWLAHYWGALALALMINQVRTFVAHFYEGDGEAMDRRAQAEDTITLGGWFFVSDLVCPLGDRYHALHHLLPTLPYHQMPRVHALLLERLGGDAAYRRTGRGVTHALVRLWRRAGQDPRARGDGVGLRTGSS